MNSYADTVRLQHVPCVLTTSKDGRARAVVVREEGLVEPELIAAVTSMGKFGKFHPTVAMSGEVFPEGFTRRCIGSLLDNNVIKVQVNQDLVKRDTQHLLKHAMIAYFVGSKPSREALAL